MKNFSPFAKIQNKWLRRVFSWSFQLVLFTIIVWVADSFYARNLLSNGNQVPDFSLPLLSSQTNLLQVEKKVNLIEKGKTTLLYFWAPWCSVCKLSINNLNSLHSDTVNVYAVALSYSNEAEIRAIIADKKVTTPVVLGNAEVEAAFKIEGYPTIYIIDSDGKIKTKTIGYTTNLGMQLRL